MSETNGNLPNGERWSAFDTLSWITFGEVRKADYYFEFPKGGWSHNWEHWPPEWLPCAFEELATGIPWTPDPDGIGPLGPDGQRAWALRIMAESGENAGELLKALTGDIERYRAIQNAWGKARADLNEAMRRGRSRVWGIKAHAPSKPDPDGTHELLDPLLFTDTRGVNEAGWIDWTPDGLGFIDYRGPSYDRVFFDSAEVKALWPPASADAGAILGWMIKEAETFLARGGRKPKRDMLVGDCVAVLKCRYEDAEAAYSKLPTHLRRSRGERDGRSKSAS